MPEPSVPLPRHPAGAELLLDGDAMPGAVAALRRIAAAPSLGLRMVTTVAGRQDVAAATRAARAALSDAIPVHAGCEAPLMGPPVAIGSPEPGLHAVDAMAEFLSGARQPVTICTTGPLTNLALLIRRRPDLTARIGLLVVLGGAIRVAGDATRNAELAIHADPLAAALVFDSLLPTALLPLDVTRELPGGPETAIPAFLLSPDAFAFRPGALRVEVDSPLTRGRTVPDWFGQWKRPAHVQVATSCDTSRLEAA